MSTAGLGTDPSAATTPAGVPASPHEAATTPAGLPASLHEAATVLADHAIAALPAWVERCVAEASEPHGPAVAADLRAPALAAGVRCAAETGPALRELLFTDVDAQHSTPLSILRDAVRFPTEVLRAGGVPAPERDEFDASRFPDDPYGLTPASFADIEPELGPVGIVWGAAKAFEVLQRRRAGPQR
ncbi:hypothetical protein [Candidatus Poriferisodalis sp.]|uniref:hypothetical protein n=1 Tax=Candidatus Poriferisodalis sp. TaxID=3101277 RepID=UPI003B0241E6